MQQDKKLKVKPLITDGSGINESLKLEKVPTPCSISTWKGALIWCQVYQHRHGGCLTIEEALN